MAPFLLRLASGVVLSGMIAVLSSGFAPTRAQEGGCVEVPLGLVARIDASMKYVDVWIRAARATPVPGYDEVWFVSGDAGGPELNSQVEIAHFVTTSLDPSTATLFKVTTGHADYLSDLPATEEAGLEVGFLTEGLGEVQQCAIDAAKRADALGIDRATWEERNGQGTDSARGFSTSDGSTQFTLQGDRISALTHQLNEPLTLSEARVLSHDFIPSDSRRIEETVEAMRTETPNLYHSEWFAEQFDQDIWGGADPGTFSVVFAVDPVTGLASSFSISPGGSAA